MSLENLKKHQGQLTNTGVRVAVVFRKLPTDDTVCLVVETERLPDSYHDQIIQILNSREASETNDLYEVLNRRSFPDGTNCLTSLHQRGYLRKEPVSNITMIPLPGHAVPLELINSTIDKKVDEYVAKQKLNASSPSDSIEKLVSATNDPKSVAQGLLYQAALLEKDAVTKREEAYVLCPDVRPKTGRPPLRPDEKIQSIEARKAKRLERDRKKAAQAKLDKKKSDMKAKVDAKLKRDAAKLTT